MRLIGAGNSAQPRYPYCRNYSVEERNEAVERAIVVIHGTNRTADSYYHSVLNAAVQAHAETKTIILAPQFLTEEDIINFNLGNAILFWSDGGWKQGDGSESTAQHPRPASISSFGVVDSLFERLSNRDNFPNLTQIVIVGHSAGGQFVNRFAAGSKAQQTFQLSGIQLQVISIRLMAMR